MIVSLAVLAGCLLPLAMGRVRLINPPEGGHLADYSRNPSYPYGSVIPVAWTEADGNAATSLTLWQINQTTGLTLGDMEYITRNSISTTSFTWIVATSKDLAVSNIFQLSIFEEGNRVSDSNSQYFNITQRPGSEPGDETPSLSNSAVPSPTTTLATTSVPASDGNDEQSPPRTSQEPVPSAQGNGSSLDKSTIIGLAVAMPCVLILGILGGCVFWRSRRKRAEQERRNYDAEGPQESYANGNPAPYTGSGLVGGPHELYGGKVFPRAELVASEGDLSPAGPKPMAPGKGMREMKQSPR